VIGGGKPAREYIKKGRELEIDEQILDEIGILITRVNAKIITSILSNSNPNIPDTTENAKKLEYPIIVMGGTTPGHSTDKVGAELASITKADRFIIATNVDGVYDKDPNKYSNAKKINEINIKDLIKQYGTNWITAGKNIIIDGPALEIINKKNIKTFVLNGKHLKNLEKGILNKSFNGTIIKI
jgi:uridylate kinase